MTPIPKPVQTSKRVAKRSKVATVPMFEGVVSAVPAYSLLTSLDSDSVAMVILDPPESLGSLAAATHEDHVSQHGTLLMLLGPIAEQVKRVLIPGGTVVCMGSAVVVATWDLVASWSDLEFAADITILWDTPPKKRRQHRGGPEIVTTPLHWHIKPGFRLAAREVSMESNVLVCSEVENKLDVVQRPVELYNYLISLLTEPGDLVVDPYCGTGSALVAAEMCGRRWAGSDTDRRRVAIADRRVSTYMDYEEENLRPLNLWLCHKMIEVAEGKTNVRHKTPTKKRRSN